MKHKDKKHRDQKPVAQQKSEATQKPEARSWLTLRKALLGVLGLLISLLSIYLAYTASGADSLRSEIYEPLFAEVLKNETQLHSETLQGFTSSTFDSLRQNGGVARIPAPLRSELERYYSSGGTVPIQAFWVSQRTEALIPSLTQTIRSEADDAAWVHKTVDSLNSANPGKMILEFQFQHVGRSPALDTRDPAHPRIGMPGSVDWDIEDWLRFPQSAADVDRIWMDDQFLEFHPRYESWQWRITREDLKTRRLSLVDFLTPVHAQLKKDKSFKELLQAYADTLHQSDRLKVLLEDRIRHPKQLSDLVH